MEELDEQAEESGDYMDLIEIIVEHLALSWSLVSTE